MVTFTKSSVVYCHIISETYVWITNVSNRRYKAQMILALTKNSRKPKRILILVISWCQVEIDSGIIWFVALQTVFGNKTQAMLVWSFIYSVSLDITCNRLHTLLKTTFSMISSNQYVGSGNVYYFLSNHNDGFL